MYLRSCSASCMMSSFLPIRPEKNIFPCTSTKEIGLNWVNMFRLRYSPVLAASMIVSFLSSLRRLIVSTDFLNPRALFSSPEPKAQVSFSDQNLSVVRRRRCCCPYSCKLFTFSSSFPEPNFNQTWHEASLGKGDSSLYK